MLEQMSLPLTLSNLLVRSVFLVAYLGFALVTRHRHWFGTLAVGNALMMLSLGLMMLAEQVPEVQMTLWAAGDTAAGLAKGMLILAIYRHFRLDVPVFWTTVAALGPGFVAMAAAAGSVDPVHYAVTVYAAHALVLLAILRVLVVQGHRALHRKAPLGMAAACITYVAVLSLGAVIAVFGEDWAVEEAVLVVGDLVGAVLMLVATLAMPLEQEEEAARRSATIDRLTGLLNRAGFAETAGPMIAAARRRGAQVWILVVDIDHFKRLNDRYGHLAGDRALAEVASRLSSVARRREDLVARWGGEEFAVLVTIEGGDGIRLVAERTRRAIGGKDVDVGAAAPVRVTVSIGVAALAPGEAGHEQATKRADRMLYLAKAEGRDCVRVEDGSGTVFVDAAA